MCEVNPYFNFSAKLIFKHLQMYAKDRALTNAKNFTIGLYPLKIESIPKAEAKILKICESNFTLMNFNGSANSLEYFLSSSI